MKAWSWKPPKRGLIDVEKSIKRRWRKMWKSWKSLSVVEDDVVWMGGGSDWWRWGGKPCSSHLAQCLGFHPPPTTNPITPPNLVFDFSPLLLISCTSKCCISSHLAHLAIFQTLQYFLPIPNISRTIDPCFWSLLNYLETLDTLGHNILLPHTRALYNLFSENIKFCSKLANILHAFQMPFD